MKWHQPLSIALTLFIMFFCPAGAPADTGRIILPTPHMTGGMPLMQALKERKSMRRYDPKMLPEQMLSDLLWAAFGINRPESGKRTAPTARNWQDIDIYVSTAAGTYRYDAKDNTIIKTNDRDLRALTGMQGFVKTAPVNLIFVSDFGKMKGKPESKTFFAGAHTGYVSQNVYLFCASQGLATVVRAGADREALAKALDLSPEQHITLLQTVGYPKNNKP